MSTIRIGTSFNIDLEFSGASFPRRLGAWFLDFLVLCLYVYFSAQIIELIKEAFDNDSEASSALVLLFAIPLLLYHILCEVFLHGQSLGKKATGIRVVSETGGRPSVSQHIIRGLIRTSDIMVVVIMLSAPFGFGGSGQFIWTILAAFCLFVTDIILVNASAKGQRLGDMLAGTMLIRTKEQGNFYDSIFQEVGERYVPQFPQVMQLSDRDINSLKGILEAARKRSDYNLAERASDKIKAHLRIESQMSPYDFLDVLLKDYNYLSAN